MVTIKDGVDLSGIDRRMWNAVAKVEAVFGGDVTITSGREGEHSVASWHYVGRALDFRWPDGEPTLIDTTDGYAKRQDLRKQVLDACGSRFQAVAHESHLHLELERG